MTEEVEKGQILWVHTYPTTSSRRRGRRVQISVEIGSEMWICIRYKETNKNEQKPISSLYIKDTINKPAARGNRQLPDKIMAQYTCTKRHDSILYTEI